MRIEKDEFVQMTQELQNTTIYNSIISLEEKIDNLCEKKTRSKVIDSAYTIFGGIIGGFIAMFSKNLLD